MVHQQKADALAVRKPLELSDDLIILCVAVRLAGGIAYLLERINNHQLSVRMLPQIVFPHPAIFAQRRQIHFRVFQIRDQVVALLTISDLVHV